MSDLLNALKKAVVKATLDLGELDEMYAGVRLPFRINWTRGQCKERGRLLFELADIIERQRTLLETEQKETLADKMAVVEADGENNAAGWLDWWEGVLLMTPSEVEELQDAMSRPHWQWVANQIVERQAVYEAAEIKKAVGGPSHTDGAKAKSRRKSGKE